MQIKLIAVIVLCMAFLSCTNSTTTNNSPYDVSSDDRGGSDSESFKIPVPKGYPWEVTQSWGDHCEYCEEKYPDLENPYCEDSHTRSCCLYGWDFNLPGNADRGKPVLASADGTVESVKTGYNSGWGNSVVINHGGGICTRYSHMLDDTILVSEGDDVCQGLVLGEIGNTGNSTGEHLHFQFEDCDTGVSVEHAFTDGNGIPKCTKGDDVFDEYGEYDFLLLTNDTHYYCGDEPTGGDEMPEGGWIFAECGSLPECPLVPNCDRVQGFRFPDHNLMDAIAEDAVSYLYGECAIDGRSDGRFYPFEAITRAEALKVPLFLFGLTNDCGSSEIFLDVDAEDWFDDIVSCAISHGIVDSSQYFFRPDDEASFAEAIKFVVEAAAKAGLITIVVPDEGHFPNFPENHWAYKYIETLWAYGALMREPDLYYPDKILLRQEFMVMAAKLSPCFCSNIICEDDCECDQALFACSDPEDDDPGTGGGDFWQDNLEIDCFVDADDNECVDESVQLYIRCDIGNDSDEVLRINNLVLSITSDDDADVCEVTDPDLHIGEGTQNVEPGDTRTVNGHFEILCEEMPEGHDIEVSYDLLEKVDGEKVWTYEVADGEIDVESEYFDECSTATSDDDDSDDDDDDDYALTEWDCVSGRYYTVSVLVPGGSFDILTSGNMGYQVFSNLGSVSLELPFQCEDFPLAVLVHGAASGFTLAITGTGAPSYALWPNYEDDILFHPPSPPDAYSSYYSTSSSYINLLAVIPEGN